MLYVAIVMYNKKLEDIVARYTANQLLEQHGKAKTKIVIIDNSDRGYTSHSDENLAEFVSTHGIAYINSGGNVGLSKAYNKALEYALHDSKDVKSDFLMLLDDGTDMSYDYMYEVYKAHKDPGRGLDGVNVITGIIESGGKPMSPVNGFTFIYNEKNCIKKPGVYKDVCCISSGMAVRLDALEKVGGFDESLFLDMIDYTLMYNLSKHDLCTMLVVNARLVQSFSGRQNDDRNAALKRFKIYSKDFMRFCEITGRSKAYGRLHLLKRKVALEIKTK